MTTDEILKKHGLDFQIIKAPLGATIEGETHLTPYYGLFNSQTMACINTCKEGYGVSQNRDIVDMVLEGTKRFGGKLSVTKAGSINEGRRVFLQLAIDGLSVVGGDNITRYITVIDSNDGSTGLSVGIGDEVAHCTNQFFRFYRAGNAKFRHTATISDKIRSIPSLIQIALGESLQQIKVYERFLSTPLTRHLANKMVLNVLGGDRELTAPAEYEKLATRTKNMIDVLHSNIDTECAIVGNNVWGLFNGLTRYTTHEQKVPNRVNGREESLIVGEAYKKAIVGYNFCLEAAN
jgi:Domain of unknown function (DUF932)